jgi:hypothetical protein
MLPCIVYIAAWQGNIAPKNITPKKPIKYLPEIPIFTTSCNDMLIQLIYEYFEKLKNKSRACRMSHPSAARPSSSQDPLLSAPLLTKGLAL